MSASRKTSLIELATVAGFCAFLFVFGLDAFGLLGADEPRYAQIAREMLERGDPVTPTLHGEPWLEKPPLYYWGAMLSFATLGVSDFAARLPTALLATAMILFVYGFMRRFHPGAQVDAALMTASAAAVLGFARGASTDMPLAAMFTMAMLAWYGFYGSGRRRWLAAFYLLLGLTVLAKGPVGPGLAGVILAVFALLRSRAEPPLRLLGKTLWLPGILLFLAVVLPWYVAVQMANPEFVRVFLVEHNLLRFSTPLYQHVQPFWFYLPVLLLGLAPWTVLALAALAGAARRRWTEPGAATAPPADAFEVYLLLWALLPVAFFSLSQSKLPGYILPAMPAFTLLLALRLHRVAGQAPRSLLLAAHSAFSGVVLAGALLSPYIAARAAPPPGAVMAAAALGLVVAAAMYVTVRRQGTRLLRFVTLVPVIVGVAFILRGAAPPLDATQSVRPMWQHMERMGAAEPKVVVTVFQVSRHVEYGLGWYRNRYVPRYERGEIPEHDHLVVTREGGRAALQQAAGERRVSPLGGFPARRVEFFWVSAPADHSGHDHAEGEPHDH